MTDHKTWVKNIYDKVSPDYGGKNYPFFNYFGERLVLLGSPSIGDKILDVATGRGAVLFPAAKLVGPKGTAIGIDLSPRMIEETTRKATSPWIELHQMDAEHLLFPDYSFDLVFCAFALFFFPNIAQALSECKRVLKPHGRFTASTFGKKDSLNAWIFEKIKNCGVILTLTITALDDAAALRKVLANAGFTQIEIHEESKIFWHENAEDWWNSLWTHGVRARLEQLSPDDLEKLKEEALSYAGKGRISEERYVLYAIAKP
ncbi:MAG: methyltransferase domain-containing protein [Chlamydiota bacterium]